MTTDPTAADAAAPPPAAAAAAAPDTPPDHRDMYILILGLIVGLLMSPWIMGRFMDDVSYEKWYLGGGDKVALMKTHRAEQKQKDTELLDRLVSTGVTKEAVDEMRAELADHAQQERLPHEAAIAIEQQANQTWQRGLMMALVLAAIVLMLIEPVFEMVGPMAAVRRRLVTGRYGLLALWIVFALAKPHAMAGISWGFAIMAVLVIVGATLLPLLFKRIASEVKQ